VVDELRRCGFEVQSGFAFCPKCGAKQPRLCAGCGFACAPDFAFCPRCGAQVDGSTNTAGRQQSSPIVLPTGNRPRGQTAQAAVEPARTFHPANPETEADRRTVTVLFADLSGFTALSEQLDPELMRTLQNELFEELTGGRSSNLAASSTNSSAMRFSLCSGAGRA